MPYYILYPKSHSRPVKVQHKRPRADYRVYGFAEGPLKNGRSVKVRLNQMNVPDSQRPKKFRTEGALE